MDPRYMPPSVTYNDRVPCYCFSRESNGDGCRCRAGGAYGEEGATHSMNRMDSHCDSKNYLGEDSLRRLAVQDGRYTPSEYNSHDKTYETHHYKNDRLNDYHHHSHNEVARLHPSERYSNGEYDRDDLYHKKHYTHEPLSFSNHEEAQYEDCSNYSQNPNYQWINDRLSEEPVYYEYSDQESPLDLTIRKSDNNNGNFAENCQHIPDEEESDESVEVEDGVRQRLELPDYLQDDVTDLKSTWLKKIQTGNRSRVRSPRSWEFVLRLLEDPRSNPSMIRWENEEKGTFRLVRKADIGRIWGMRSEKHKDKELSYDSFARNLRYHYKSKMLVPVSEKHLVYQFGELAMSIHEKRKREMNYPFSATT